MKVCARAADLDLLGGRLLVSARLGTLLMWGPELKSARARG
jgi:hypothetical protein